MVWRRGLAIAALCIAVNSTATRAQEPPTASSSAPVMLTLKRAVELALQNSKDIQLARLQTRIADETANRTSAEFRPNLYAGSGAG